MPTKSPAQARLMEGIAHGWHPSGLSHPPPKKVAEEFVEADKRDNRKPHAKRGQHGKPGPKSSKKWLEGG